MGGALQRWYHEMGFLEEIFAQARQDLNGQEDDGGNFGSAESKTGVGMNVIDTNVVRRSTSTWLAV